MADDNRSWLFVATAKGMEYVFRSDKLKQMVGASALVELAPEKLSSEILAMVYTVWL